MPPKLPKFPGMPSGFPDLSGSKHIFKPGGYHSGPENEAELRRLLTPYLNDERRDARKYEDLAARADMVGRPDIGATLKYTAEDEHRHFLSIAKMIKDLR